MTEATDEIFLAQAIELAKTNVADGGGPFGALIVRTESGEIVATGQNRVTRDLDPTAHAEVTAIRRACTAIGDFSLAGHTLYTSCEPCPLCLASALWGRLDRVVFAADRNDAAEGGFDDREFYELFEKRREEWDMAIDAVRVPTSFEPFAAWIANEARTEY
ncbi:nucleoside deaminase [Nocardioides sp. Kera G14]|uniref:nucleoside deaminase n=1 Tax=Nocardioides sp. Kera G14 TaxID=2884264 RepID=UPI001D12CA01|nr:nucleoside deaminase [Nocardioides sp. Kera G14]UDY23717.1 nucleoside deaminase [Nocardioides sp. Kera G14]